MRRIIGTRGVGKTTQMIKDAINNETSNKLIFVVSCPDYVQGFVNGINPDRQIEILSYKQFIDRKDSLGQYVDIYIDEIDQLLKVLTKNIKGYTLSLEDFMIQEK